MPAAPRDRTMSKDAILTEMQSALEALQKLAQLPANRCQVSERTTDMVRISLATRLKVLTGSYINRLESPLWNDDDYELESILPITAEPKGKK